MPRKSRGISHLFSGAPPVIPFLTAGFPSDRVFRDAARAAFDSGAGGIEIGMPFSDPLADGPAIQHSSQVALARGMTLAGVLELTGEVAREIAIPVFLMGYLNPLLRMGLARFAARAAAAGAAGTIVPDCPVEEAGTWVGISRRHGLSNILLIAPTTPDKRVRRIDRTSTDFSYCVSVAGVTGTRSGVTPATKTYLRRVRAVARKPFVVGFGISEPDHIRSLRSLADGFVVGSALVPLLEGRRVHEAAGRVGRMVRALVRATD
jgi:tryptophan synthase alpha chain